MWINSTFDVNGGELWERMKYGLHWVVIFIIFAVVMG